MKTIKIYPYKLGSESARALASALDTVCVKPDGRYKYYNSHLVVNWGSSTIPNWYTSGQLMLNKPDNVRLAVNKLDTFIRLNNAGVQTPEWTIDIEEAQRWVENGYAVVERHNLTGSKGDGIIVVDRETRSITYAPLYTKLIQRAREYRVHVFDGQVIDLQQKKRRVVEDDEVVSGDIKNLDNGWVFVRDDITQPPREIFNTAIRAVQALGLDFGGVDIIVKDGECYVLEINCAVGLEGSTINSYTNAIKSYATNKK